MYTYIRVHKNLSFSVGPHVYSKPPFTIYMTLFRKFYETNIENKIDINKISQKYLVAIYKVKIFLSIIVSCSLIHITINFSRVWVCIKDMILII